MKETSQKRAVRNYRVRLRKSGLARFEVLGLDVDRDLIRSLAKRLAEGPDAASLRADVRRSVAEVTPQKGGIWKALRESPLVGADLDLTRQRTHGRKIDL
ncbi:MAG TPA: hypothetical protein VHY84_17170 [Bryobacteraceae bacterium]|jgi:hypothetical protein|nr:hypothetical protein [Bryobacteraceae bacterium]